MDKRQLFLKNVAQTSEFTMGLEISKAKGMYIYDGSGKRYLDLNSGISVSSLGHLNPRVVEAVESQLKNYMHTMVYGEHVQSPQIKFAGQLLPLLGPHFEKVYFLMSGTEAVELAMKLGRLYTGRYEIIACKNAYHGSTIGAESLRSDLDFTKFMAPGVTGIKHISFNDISSVDRITKKTACVITEVVQAESGVNPPDPNFLTALRKRCDETGTILIFDEIQTGFFRTGKLFAFQKYEVTPDILLMGKAMGGGMPVSAVASSSEIMSAIIKNPSLAHITTFGGHPVCVAAAQACLTELLEQKIGDDVESKGALFEEKLKHPIIKEVRRDGLMIAIELTKRKYLKHVVEHTIKSGALIDYFLFNNRSFRLAPPLIINEDQIRGACGILLESMDYAESQYS
jgi:acetylornithine/succinyldiaminopimelate/putrescine aminotransferase